MLSMMQRAADKAVGAFLPKAEAKADYWGAYCGCQGYYRYYERWTWVNGVPTNLGCRPRDTRCNQW